MKTQGSSLRPIAKTMNRTVSTISRELNCNTGKKGYRYKQAQTLTNTKHSNKNKAIKLTDTIKTVVAVFEKDESGNYIVVITAYK